MSTAKKEDRFNVSMPRWLRERAGTYAETQDLTFAAYVRKLLRADLEGAGVDVTPPKAKRKGARS